ncbi:MAG: hypothetical protein JWO31_2567 [Phycisphaerales bacterium]|nr:hypothetical protein [Phycisphaerales bacterium]
MAGTGRRVWAAVPKATEPAGPATGADAVEAAARKLSNHPPAVGPCVRRPVTF